MALPDGRHIMATGIRDLFVWEIDSRECVYHGTIDAICRDGFASFSLVHDALRFATADGTTEFALWDLGTFEKQRVFSGHTEEVRGFVFLGDDHGISVSHMSLRRWDLGTGECLREAAAWPAWCVTAISTPTGRIAVGTTRGVQVIDPESLQSVLDIQLAFGILGRDPDPDTYKPWCSISTLTWIEEGTHLVCGGSDGLIRQIDANTGDVMQVWRACQEVESLALLPGGDVFVASCSDGSVKFWRISSEQHLKVVELNDSVPGVCVTSEGRVFAACKDGLVYEIEAPP
ncbi:MAG: hypothetical protein AAGF11_10415 [Myxococcota bacterium]